MMGLSEKTCLIMTITALILEKPSFFYSHAIFNFIKTLIVYSHNPSFRCMREVSTIVCIHPPVCKYPICSGHGECQLGICKCNKPWTGEGCQLLNCSIMKCNGRGICANTSSQCNCTKPGYTGPLCDKGVSLSYHGCLFWSLILVFSVSSRILWPWM
jgi:hypothetical protein